MQHEIWVQTILLISWAVLGYDDNSFIFIKYTHNVSKVIKVCCEDISNVVLTAIIITTLYKTLASTCMKIFNPIQSYLIKENRTFITYRCRKGFEFNSIQTKTELDFLWYCNCQSVRFYQFLFRASDGFQRASVYYFASGFIHPAFIHQHSFKPDEAFTLSYWSETQRVCNNYAIVYNNLKLPKV